MPIDSVTVGPATFRQMMRAKQAVQPRKVDSKIDIGRILFNTMMPVMESRRNNNSLHPTQIPAEIRMDEGGP